ncbi:MAG: hypothetical protein ACTHVY_02060 [Brevibacterium yomogidense]|uniref:hypothetical protein n=1 Tax=Brevibacterium sp. Mu109 TaxID=1255669 RepID=UPI000C56B971|nr:hypothetical protein [Brevibacterium sp. Mu109]SMX77030.1 hypothetical protein BSP109_01362 [Brevibacterium sp. Mu109]
MTRLAMRVAGTAVVLGVAGGGLAAGAASATPVTGASVTATSVLGTSAAVVLSAAGGTDDSGSLLGTVQTYATQLEEESLIADEGSVDLYGGGFEELRELQDEAEVPTYIVFDSALDFQQDTTVAQLLADVLPGEEFVVMVVGEGGYMPAVEVVAPDEDRTRLLESQFYSTSMSGARSDSVLVQLRTGLERLQDPEPVTNVSSGDNSTWRWIQYQITVYPMRSFVIAVGLIAVVAAALWFFIPRGAKRKRYRIPKAVARAAAAADRGAMRRALGDDALDVVERLEKLQTDGIDRETADLVEHGLDAYGQARRIADDADSQEDDLAGAMVLMGIAESAVSRAEASIGSGRKGDRGRFRLGARKTGGGAPSQELCSIDPRHGQAKKTIDADVAGREGTITLPACAKCVHDAGNDNPLQWLSVAGKPYVLRDTVWASTLYGGTQEDLVDAVVEARVKG